MDNFFELNDYYVALIIVTIVTIAISLALSFYFIFLPAIRIQKTFNTIQTRGLDTIKLLTSLANTVSQVNDEVLQDTCESLIYAADFLFGCPKTPDGVTPIIGCLSGLWCPKDNPLIPSICDPFLPTTPCECA